MLKIRAGASKKVGCTRWRNMLTGWRIDGMTRVFVRFLRSLFFCLLHNKECRTYLVVNLPIRYLVNHKNGQRGKHGLSCPHRVSITLLQSEIYIWGVLYLFLH